MLTIISWAGIGDTLRNLCLVPHQFLFRTFGVRTKVIYGRPSQEVSQFWWEGNSEYVRVPKSGFYQHFVEHCPSLEWAGEVDGRPGWSQPYGPGRIANRALRDTLRLLNGNTPPYFPFEIRLTEDELAALPEKQPGITIGIQTHLDGMKTKRWGHENWRKCIENLCLVDGLSAIFLFDTDPQVAELCVDPRVHTTLGYNLRQSITMIPKLDLMISIDSWTKYIAAAHKIPQVIIVPDQRSEYAAFTPEKMAREYFAGIFAQPHNITIGLSGTYQRPALTLEKITDLSPEELLSHTRVMLSKLPKR